jgi:MATE family multidrug resistance protein
MGWKILALLVGKSIGEKNFVEAAKTGWQCLCLGAGFMFCAGIFFILVPQAVLHVYTQDESVIHTGLSIIFIVSLFQIFDGTQAVLTGALRGIAETRAPAIANFVGHWLIGLPLGLYLAFYRSMTLIGIWTGLATGLIFVSLVLLYVWNQKSKPHRLELVHK